MGLTTRVVLLHHDVGMTVVLEGIQLEDLMKNATSVASYVYHAAMTAERVPRKRRPAAAR